MVGPPNVSSRALEDNRAAVLHSTHPRSVSRAMFGSPPRGDGTQDRDIDLLVELEPTSSTLDLIEREEDGGNFSAPAWTRDRRHGLE